MFEERMKIEHWLDVHIPQREIAERLGRSPSTISKEIKNNSVLNRKTGKREYRAYKAHLKASVRQREKKVQCFKLSQPEYAQLRKLIEERIPQGWSPESLSSFSKNEEHGFQYVSPKAIRKWIQKRRPHLERHLFWKRNNRRTGPKRKKSPFLDDTERKTMQEREELFPNINNEFGHWEMDFIVSKQSSSVILVITERLTKLTKIKRLEKRKNDSVNEAIFSLLENEVVRSITTDNDIAFQHWRVIEKQLNTSIFFTDPYASWQKGLVENINRWIREFIPKKTDLKLVSEELLMSIENYLNHKARIVLGGYTSYEKFCFLKNGVRIHSLLFDLPEKVS